MYSASELSGLCRDQKRGYDGHEQYCMELFRRAIVENHQESWDEIIDRCYERLVISWVRQQNPPAPYSLEDYAQQVFERFVAKYTPEKFARATRLSSILSFMKSIAFTIVLDAKRATARRVQEVAWDDDREQGEHWRFEDDLDFDLLMREILDCCKDDQERLIAKLKFRNGLKPRQIYERTNEFENLRAIERVQENLIRRLKRNPKLKLIAGKS